MQRLQLRDQFAIIETGQADRPELRDRGGEIIGEVERVGARGRMEPAVAWIRRPVISRL
jgi:hypothetical protein